MVKNFDLFYEKNQYEEQRPTLILYADASINAVEGFSCKIEIF
jgi:hypothetical protein